jgi:transposase
MDRRAKVELFEKIRQGYRAGKTIRQLAKEHEMHRRLVRRAITGANAAREEESGAETTEAGSPEGADRADAGATSQRRASNGGTRLRKEHPDGPIAEPTVRRYVELRRREMGLKSAEVCVPQSYNWGQEAQVDWFEATARLGGERCDLQFFAMRSMASRDAFHRAYANATQQAFLEGHELAFAYFEGVFRTLHYDNLGAAVKKILRGRQRVGTDRIVTALRY